MIIFPSSSTLCTSENLEHPLFGIIIHTNKNIHTVLELMNKEWVQVVVLSERPWACEIMQKGHRTGLHTVWKQPFKLYSLKSLQEKIVEFLGQKLLKLLGTLTTLIWQEKLWEKFGSKNRENVAVLYFFHFFSLWQLWFHEKNCRKKFGSITRENIAIAI